MEPMKSGTQQLYKPAEACKMAEVAPYVLRYWETEFAVLSEGKEKIGARSYTERDVRIISRIRELLYDEGFTVAGAKKRLDAEIAQGRFDDRLKAAPSPEQQRGGRQGAPTPPAPQAPAVVSQVAVSEAPESAFLLAEPGSAKASPAEKALASAQSFPDRKRVIRELKEIVRILDRGRKR